MTTMAKSAANRANTKPVTPRTNICTWPDPGALSSTRTGSYVTQEARRETCERASERARKRDAHNGSAHVELQVDSPWLADPVNERLSFTPKQRDNKYTSLILHPFLVRVSFFSLLRGEKKRRRGVGATVSCFRESTI